MGGREEGPGRSGRGAKSKSVVVVAVEQRGAGKSDQKQVPGFAALEGFLKARVRPGSHILTDGWNGYKRLKKNGFEHTATAISGQNEAAHSLSPWVNITLSNLKRFLLGTHHKVEQKHLKRYVAEFNYRLNRRTMEPTMLPQADPRLPGNPNHHL